MDSPILALPVDHTYSLPLFPVWMAILFALIALFFFALALMIAYTFIGGGPGNEMGFLVCLVIASALGFFSYVSFHEHFTQPPEPVVATQGVS